MTTLPSQEDLSAFAQDLALDKPWGSGRVPRWVARDASSSMIAIIRILLYVDRDYVNEFLQCPKGGRHLLKVRVKKGTYFATIEDNMVGASLIP
jgi:hypothetical protein